MAGEFTKFGTVTTMMARVFSELGLTVPSSYVGNTDDTVVQLLNLMTSAGQDLCLMNDWQYLHKEWTQVLVVGTTSYALPADWNSFVDSTMWNSSSAWPVIGPVSPQIWRLLKARTGSSTTISLMYRIIGNMFVLYNTPSAIQTLVSDYYSRGWILQVDGLTFRDNPAADSDSVLFDQRIIIPLIKLRWRAGKGFDTATDAQDFNDAWDLVVGRDTPAPTLSVGPSMGFPFLGFGNIPDSGYGS